MNLHTTEITVSNSPTGWVAVFTNSQTMPNGTPLPLPYTVQLIARRSPSKCRCGSPAHSWESRDARREPSDGCTYADIDASRRRVMTPAR
jgi:hypothetical protein